MVTITLYGDKRDFLTYEERPDGTVEITDIAVGSERRQGKGRKLIEILFRRLGDKPVWAITRSDNEIAQQFYEKLCFHVAGVLRRFYGADKGVDAVMYHRMSRGPV